MEIKRYLYILILVFFYQSIFSQDTIYFRSGDITPAKIKEVGITEVKYNQFNNLGGPVYIANKNDIRKIRYQGGNVDTFAFAGVYLNSTNTSPIPRMAMRKKNISYNGSIIDDEQLFDLLNKYPFADTKSKLLLKHREMKKHKVISGAALGLGLGFGFAVPVVTTFYALNQAFNYYGNANQVEAIFLGGVIAGAAIRITGFVLQKVHKNKAIHNKEEIVLMYNQMK